MRRPLKTDPATSLVASQSTRVPRASVMLSAAVECFGGGAATKHRVRDLSPAGIRIDQATGMRVGTTVLISVGALEAVGATVRWVTDDCAGLVFAEQIDPAQARMRAAIAPGRSATPAPVRAAALVFATGWIAELRDPYRK